MAGGCGGGGGGGGGGGAGTATGPTALVVREYDGDRPVATRRLDCAAQDGPCARIAALLPRLRPDPQEICTEVYGGPQRLVVEGTRAGSPVRVEVTRVNGCEIARYDLLREALDAP